MSQHRWDTTLAHTDSFTALRSPQNRRRAEVAARARRIGKEIGGLIVAASALFFLGLFVEAKGWPLPMDTPWDALLIAILMRGFVLGISQVPHS